MDKLEQRELTEWMSLIDEQKEGTILRIPDSTEGKDEANPVIIKEGESKLIITQVFFNIIIKPEKKICEINNVFLTLVLTISQYRYIYFLANQLNRCK